MNKAVFIDRDGAILDDPLGAIYKKEHVAILPGVIQALEKLRSKNYFLLVVSNQSVIADGLITYEGVLELHKFINSLLQEKIDRFYFCPHHPRVRDDVPDWAKKYRIDCTCRKPAPGLLTQAAREFSIDLQSSWLIGDMISDIAAGAAAGCKTILVQSIHSKKIITTSKPFDTKIKADFGAKDLCEAAEIIVDKSGSENK